MSIEVYGPQVSAELTEVLYHERVDPAIFRTDVAALHPQPFEREEVERIAARALFRTFDALRQLVPNGPPLFVWETEYLAKNGALHWTPEILRNAPDQFALARDWLSSRLFPTDVLTRIIELEDPTHRSAHERFREEVKSAAENYLHKIPGKLGTETTLMLLYSAAGIFPEVMPLVATAGASVATLQANFIANAGDTYNQFRRLGLVYAVTLEDFIRRRDRDLTDFHFSKSPSQLVIGNINAALEELNGLDANIELIGKLFGGSVGTLATTALRYGAFSPLGAAAGVGISLGVRHLFGRKQHDVKDMFARGLIEFEKSLASYQRSLALDQSQAENSLNGTYQAAQALTDQLNPTNKELDVVEATFPWVFTLISTALQGSPSPASSLLIGQLLGRSTLAQAEMTVRLGRAREERRTNIGVISAALDSIECKKQPDHIIAYDPQEKTIDLSAVTLPDGRGLHLDGIRFRPGVNIIEGRSGSGKSTIMRAIEASLEPEAVTATWVGRGTMDFIGLETIVRLRQGRAEAIRALMQYQLTQLEGNQDAIAHLAQTSGISVTAVTNLLPALRQAFALSQPDSLVLTQWAETYAGNGTKTPSELTRVLNILVMQYFYLFAQDTTPDILYRRITHDSGASYGQGNRIGLALGLANTQSKVLLIDEPTAGLDETTSAMIAERIADFSRRFPKIIIVLGTHDPIFRRIFASGTFHSQLSSFTQLEETSHRHISYPNQHRHLHDLLSVSLKRKRADEESQDQYVAHFVKDIQDLTEAISSGVPHPGEYDQRLLDVLLAYDFEVSVPCFNNSVATGNQVRTSLEQLFAGLQRMDPSWQEFFRGEFGLSQLILTQGQSKGLLRLIPKLEILRALQDRCFQLSRDPNIRSEHILDIYGENGIVQPYLVGDFLDQALKLTSCLGHNILGVGAAKSGEFPPMFLRFLGTHQGLPVLRVYRDLVKMLEYINQKRLDKIQILHQPVGYNGVLKLYEEIKHKSEPDKAIDAFIKAMILYAGNGTTFSGYDLIEAVGNITEIVEHIAPENAQTLKPLYDLFSRPVIYKDGSSNWYTRVLLIALRNEINQVLREALVRLCEALRFKIIDGSYQIP